MKIRWSLIKVFILSPLRAAVWGLTPIPCIVTSEFTQDEKITYNASFMDSFRLNI